MCPSREWRCIRCLGGRGLDVALGMSLGCAICVSFILWIVISTSAHNNQGRPSTPNDKNQEIKPRDRLYVGIIAPWKTFPHNIQGCRTTWCKDEEIARVEIFTSIGSKTPRLQSLGPMEVIDLRGTHSHQVKFPSQFKMVIFWSSIVSFYVYIF